MSILQNIIKPNIIKPIIIISAVSIITEVFSRHTTFRGYIHDFNDAMWAVLYMYLLSAIFVSLLWLCYGLVELKASHLINRIKEYVSYKLSVNISDKLFDFYTLIENNPKRFSQLLSQKNGKQLLLKPKLNIFAFLEPILWLARMKIILPIFIFWLISFLLSVIWIVINYSYNTEFPQAIEDGIKSAGLFTFIFVLYLRIFLLIYGDSIEVLFLINKIKPYFIYYQNTEKIPDNINTTLRRNWFGVILIWAIYYSTLIPMISFLL